MDDLHIEEFDEIPDDGGHEPTKRGSKHSSRPVLNINPKTQENMRKYRKEMLELLQPALKAYHRAYKEHTDKYVEEERVRSTCEQCRRLRDLMYTIEA